jgi:hypothetical protein
MHCILDIQHQEQTIRQLVHTLNQTPRRVLQGVRRRVEDNLFEIDNVADIVHQEAEDAVAGAHNYVHGQVICGSLGHIQAASQVNRSDNLSPQIDESPDDFPCQGNTRHLLMRDHFLNVLHGHSKELPIEEEGAKPLPMRHWRFAPCAGG